MITDLEQILLDQRERFNSRKDWIFRDIDFDKYLRSQRITVISGLRRVGKSTLLRQFSTKVDDFHYVNFDDRRLINFKAEHFADLMLLFYKRSLSNNIFIDEIQSIAKWDRFIRQIHDKGFNIYITESKGKFPDLDLNNYLSGRYLKVELPPFSFSEFLEYHHYHMDKQTPRNMASLLDLFDIYIKFGGMPEFLKIPK